MNKLNNKYIGSEWGEVEKELFTPEEIEQSDLRVSAIEKLIELRNDGKINYNFYKKVVDDDKELEIIGEFIKARKEKNISQKELEILTGINQVNISRIEKMSTSPRLDTMRRLLRPLGYTLAVVPLKESFGKRRA